MGISPETFWASIACEFEHMATSLDYFIERFETIELDSMSVESFNEFCLKNHVEDETLRDKLYDLFNYLRLFKHGGKFSLYKHRQPEWKAA